MQSTISPTTRSRGARDNCSQLGNARRGSPHCRRDSCHSCQRFRRDRKNTPPATVVVHKHTHTHTHTHTHRRKPRSGVSKSILKEHKPLKTIRTIMEKIQALACIEEEPATMCKRENNDERIINVHQNLNHGCSS
jgi:hypothetical protein